MKKLLIGLPLLCLLVVGCGGRTKGISCGGATDKNGISWDARCPQGYGEACYIEETCWQPTIQEGARVLKAAAIDILPKEDWCEDYTELYQELLKDERRFDCVVESFK